MCEAFASSQAYQEADITNGFHGQINQIKIILISLESKRCLTKVKANMVGETSK